MHGAGVCICVGAVVLSPCTRTQAFTSGSLKLLRRGVVHRWPHKGCEAMYMLQACEFVTSVAKTARWSNCSKNHIKTLGTMMHTWQMLVELYSVSLCRASCLQFTRELYETRKADQSCQWDCRCAPDY